MKPTPPTDGAAELREQLINKTLLWFETQILATRGDSYHRAYARNETANEILAAFATYLRTIESKLPEKQTMVVTPDVWKRYQERYGEGAGYALGIAQSRGVLTAEIEAITKENK